jgi:hypothetical protein
VTWFSTSRRDSTRRHEILLRFVVKAQEPLDGQIAAGAVVAIEEAQLQGAVGGIVGQSLPFLLKEERNIRFEARTGLIYASAGS